MSTPAERISFNDLPDSDQPEDLVKFHAAKQGVDPNLALRVMKQESGGNPRARSPKGAIGLMQLMPATAKQLGVNPHDPEDNAKGGVAYLKQQLDTFNGDPKLAAAGYNAGPGAVKKYGGVPPYKETQDYVRAVAGASPATERISFDDLPDESASPKVTQSQPASPVLSPKKRFTWTPPPSGTGEFSRERAKTLAEQNRQPNVDMTPNSSVTGKRVTPRSIAAQRGIVGTAGDPVVQAGEVESNIARLNAAGSKAERQAIAEEIGRSRKLTDAEQAAARLGLSGFVKSAVTAPLESLGTDILKVGTQARKALGVGPKGMTPAEEAIERENIKAAAQQNTDTGALAGITRGVVGSVPAMTLGLPEYAGLTALQRYGQTGSVPEAALTGAETYMGLGLAGKAGGQFAGRLAEEGVGGAGQYAARALPLSTVPALAQGRAPELGDVGFGAAFAALPSEKAAKETAVEPKPEVAPQEKGFEIVSNPPAVTDRSAVAEHYKRIGEQPAPTEMPTAEVQGPTKIPLEELPVHHSELQPRNEAGQFDGPPVDERLAPVIPPTPEERAQQIESVQRGAEFLARPVSPEQAAQAKETHRASIEQRPVQVVEPPVAPEPESVKAAEPTPEPTPGPERVTGIKNRQVAQERADQGKPEIEVEGKRTFGDAWDSANAKRKADPSYAPTLAESVANKPRALNAEDSAVLSQDRMRLQNEHRDTMSQIEKAITNSDEMGEADARIRLNQIEKAMEVNDKASRLTGYEQGFGLAARKMMSKEDYSLARIITRAKVAKGGEIPDDVRVKLEDLSKQIEARDKQIAERDKARETAQSQLEAAQKELADLQKGKPAKVTKMANWRSKLQSGADEALAELKRLGMTQRGSGGSTEQLAQLAKYGAFRLADTSLSLAQWTRHMVDTFGDWIEPHLEDIKRQAFALLQETRKQARLEAGEPEPKTPSALDEVRAQIRKEEQVASIQKGIAKKSEPGPSEIRQKQLQKQIDELQKVVAAGKGKPDQTRKAPVYDEKTYQLEAQRERLKSEVDQQVRRLEKQNRSTPTKIADFAMGLRRLIILSSVKTIGKLTAAASMRTITTPIEEAIGTGLSKIPGIKGIAEKAAREGPMSLEAEKAALKGTFTKETPRQMLQVAKTGSSDIDVLYGGKQAHEPEMLNIVGQIHGALKVPAKRNEFFRSVSKFTESTIKTAIAKGMTPEEAQAYAQKPHIQALIMGKAYAESQRAILMSDNAAVNAYKVMTAFLRNAGDKGSMTRALGSGAARTLQWFLPIVKIPTNFVAEAGSYGIGGLKALGQVIAAKGTENLTPEQADYIMRNLKKQTVGAALMAIGYWNADKIGGYYQQGDSKDKTKPEAGTMKVFGVQIPRFLLHTPALEMLQIGATIKRVQDKTKADNMPVASGVYAGGKGLVLEVPFFDQPARLTERLKDWQGVGKFAGEEVKGGFIPPDVQNIAKMTDQDVRRNPKTFWQSVEMGIPGLRQRVPIKGSSGGFQPPAFRLNAPRSRASQ